MTQSITTKQQYWSEQLQRAEAFDGTIADYARAQGFSVQTLYRWRHCLKRRETGAKTGITQTRFTQVVTSSLHSAPSLTLDAGYLQLRFGRLPDPQWLAQLLALSARP